MVQAMSCLLPQLHLSFAAIAFTAWLSHSEALCASATAAINTTSSAVFIRCKPLPNRDGEGAVPLPPLLNRDREGAVVTLLLNDFMLPNPFHHCPREDQLLLA